MTRNLLTLGRAISLWEGSLRASRKAERTIAGYTRACEYIVETHGRDADPATLTVEDLEQVASKWRDLSPTTVVNRMVAWREFFAWGEARYGWSNPTRLLSLPRKDEPALRRLTQDELDAIAAAALRMQTRDRVMVSLFVYLGMRRGEVRSLRWRSIDLDARVILISHQTAKGRKGRSVPIPKPLADILSFAVIELGAEGSHPDAFVAHHITNRPRNWLQPGAYDPDYTRVSGVQTIDRVVKRAAELAGITAAREVTSHQFRRALLGRLLDDGASPYIVAALAGHADIKTTAAYGGGASLEAVRDLLACDTESRMDTTIPVGRAGLEPANEPTPSSDPDGSEHSGSLVTPEEDA